MQNFRLFWLHTTLDETTNLLDQLKLIVNNINLFIDVDQCIDSLTEIEEEKVFMIVSSSLAKTIVPIIHDISQLSTIFIFSYEGSDEEPWTQQWLKVNDIFTEINSICQALQQVINEYEQNLILLSIITADDEDSFISAKFFDRLDASLMYIYILKDVLIQAYTHDTTKSIDALIKYSRQIYTNNTVQLTKIDKLERELYNNTLSWSSIHECLLLSMLNDAIRTLDVEFIVRLAFVVRVLHNNIDDISKLRSNEYQIPSIVYQRQTLSEKDFYRLQQAQGGLLFFNNFLLATFDQQTSMMFNNNHSEMINVLFVIRINPTLSTTRFAIVNQSVDNFATRGNKILFDINIIFRIAQIRQVDELNSRVWHVHLILIDDDHPKLITLNNRIEEVTRGLPGWRQMGVLLQEAGKTEKAQDLYQLLLKEASNDEEKMEYYIELGLVYDSMQKYPEALSSNRHALAIMEKILLPNDPSFATVYTNIGLVHHNASEYLQAISLHEAALNIRQKTLPPNDPGFAHSYINLGGVYIGMGDWPMANSYLERGLEILQKSLSSTHPAIKNCQLGIKLCKEKICEEHKKTMERKQNEASAKWQNVSPTIKQRQKQYKIYGRNHWSMYYNDLDERIQYGLYWLDRSIYDQIELEAELCHIIPLMERFNNIQECEEEIKNVVDRTIILIITASLSVQFIPLIHDFACVTKIFIYSTDHNYTDGEILMKAYDKIAAVVLTERDLIEKVSEDWEEKETRSLLSFGIVSHWDVSLEWGKSNMLWFKLLISFLIRLKNTNKSAKEELLHFMRLSYKGNRRQLQAIEKFEQEYRARDAISWYTRDFCLYRLMNKAFRTGNINSLISLRLFIQDLYEQLSSSHLTQRKIRIETKQSILRSFRGQAMLASEVAFLSIGKYAITNSFFSTSLDREQALGFIAGGVANSSQMLVFFVIDANISLNTVPFADIAFVSNSANENEVLYGPGTLFRIKSKRRDHYEDVWIIELELCAEEDFPLKDIYNSFNIEYKREISLYDFCIFLNDMGEFRKAEKFLLRLLNESSKAFIDTAKCYHALGRVAHGMDDYDRAVSYHKTALDLQVQLIPMEPNNLANICNDLSEGYCKQGRVNLAMDYIEFAMECSLQIEDTHCRHILLSSCYHTYGKIHLMQRQYDKAMRLLNAALNYRQRSLPENHPFLAEIYMSIGMMYSLMGNNHEALKMYNVAHDVFLDLLPITHPHIGDALFSLGEIKTTLIAEGSHEQDLGQWQTHFSESYDIFQHSLPARSYRFVRAKETLEKTLKLIAASRGEDSKHYFMGTPASIVF